MNLLGRFTAGLLACCLLAAGCGSDEPAEEDSRAESDSAFPVTIQHKYGQTEISEDPQRVLSLGFQEHDFIFALGVTPIAVRYWFGDESDVIYPWAEAAAGDADPEILNMPELNFEKIAALRPDLILGMYSGISEQDYATLSDIAPTVTQTDEYVDYGVPWQITTQTLGDALGKSEEAGDLVADIEGQFEAVRSEHPEWAELTAAVVAGSPQSESGGLGFFDSQDPRPRFFDLLGFQSLPELDEIAGELFYGTASREQLDIVDTDLLIWDQLQYVEGGAATVQADPLVAQLAVVAEGRTVYLEGDIENAFGWQSPLSLPFALDGLLPALEAATDSDPAT